MRASLLCLVTFALALARARASASIIKTAVEQVDGPDDIVSFNLETTADSFRGTKVWGSPHTFVSLSSTSGHFHCKHALKDAGSCDLIVGKDIFPGAPKLLINVFTENPAVGKKQVHYSQWMTFTIESRGDVKSTGVRKMSWLGHKVGRPLRRQLDRLGRRVGEAKQGTKNLLKAGLKQLSGFKPGTKSLVVVGGAVALVVHFVGAGKLYNAWRASKLLRTVPQPPRLPQPRIEGSGTATALALAGAAAAVITTITSAGRMVAAASATAAANAAPILKGVKKAGAMAQSRRIAKMWWEELQANLSKSVGF